MLCVLSISIVKSDKEGTGYQVSAFPVTAFLFVSMSENTQQSIPAPVQAEMLFRTLIVFFAEFLTMMRSTVRTLLTHLPQLISNNIPTTKHQPSLFLSLLNPIHSGGGGNFCLNCLALLNEHT